MPRPAEQQRRTRLGKGLVVAAIVVVAAVGLYQWVAVPPLCRVSEARVAEVWNTQNQTVIRKAFLASGLPYAEDTWKRIRQRFDRYGAQWASVYRDGCLSTLVREEQSLELLNLQMACLDERRAEFAGMVRAFEQADAQLIERAVDVVAELRDVMRCVDRERLLAAYPLPDDILQRQALEVLRDQIAATRALVTAGELDQARSALDGQLVLADQYGFSPLHAEALLLRGNVQAQSGRDASAKQTFYAAAEQAELAQDSELSVQARIALTNLLIAGEDGLEEALETLRSAQTYVTRLPAGHPLEAEFHNARARVLKEQGHNEQVVKDLQVVVDIGRAHDHPSVSRHLARLSGVLGELEALDAAQTTAREAIIAAEESFGSHHPRFAAALEAAARISALLGNHAEALSLREQVVEVTQGAYPPSHPRVATALERLARSLNETGRYAEAISMAQRGLAVELENDAPRLEVVELTHNAVADAYAGLGEFDLAMQSLQATLAAVRQSGSAAMVGRALNKLGSVANRAGDHAAAEAYCRDALAIDESYLAADHPDLGNALSCIGEAQLNAGEPAKALAALSRAHNVRNRLGIAERSLARTRWLYGRALWESGSNRSLGMTYVGFAREVFGSPDSGMHDQFRAVEAWLTTHGLTDEVSANDR